MRYAERTANTEVLYLRVPPSLKVRLDEARRENGRTMNQEAIQRLLRSFDGYRR